jgi:hypothetical protein
MYTVDRDEYAEKLFLYTSVGVYGRMTRKNPPTFHRFQKGSDLTNFTIDSFCR